jgi:NADPH-dependent ferric siderophore reductase
VFGVLSRLTNALARLAAGCDGLADTLEQANAGLRSKLYLDGPAEEPPALEGPVSGGEPEAVSPSRKAKGVPRG